jgi:Bacteriocin-protection, YdeI or OmpD-Associated/Domain of unknown function (DUF1905)
MNEINSKLPLVDKEYLVQKEGKQNGWTYVVIPDISPTEKNKSGLIRVSGFIDTYELKQFNLLPMKEGTMLLPLNATVRKKIGKKVGDMVHVTLFSDDSPVVVPDDILVCLMDSDKAYAFFLTLSESNKKYYIDWIEDAKRLETKVERIAKTIERLENGVRFYDW